jgi:hypothetical protein
MNPNWPDYAQDAYMERIAIMREGNNIPDSEPTPPEILRVAREQAQREIALVESPDRNVLLLNL